MSKQDFWYGYLEAGAKSSPVLRDDSLDTGNPKTMYLFNLEKGQILEYNREIIEPKLRELKPKEKEFTSKLKSAFKKTRTGFTPKGRTLSIPAVGKPGDSETKNDIDNDIPDLDENILIQEDDSMSDLDEDEDEVAE